TEQGIEEFYESLQSDKPPDASGKPTSDRVELTIRVRLEASGFQVIGECLQIGSKAGCQHSRRAFLVVEVYHLPDIPAGQRIEVQALVVRTGVMSEGDPLDIPVIPLDRAPVRPGLIFLKGVVVKSSLFEVFPPPIGLLHQ